MSAAHVGVQAGDGLVARFGSAVVVIGSRGEGGDHEAFINALLAALDAAATGTSGPSPEQLAWQVAELIGSYRTTAPAFGLAAQIADGYLLLLHGAVRAVISSADGDVELTGRSALTWVDQVVHEPVTRIAITLADDGAVRTDPRSDLRGGLVPGAGLVLTSGRPAELPAELPLDAADSGVQLVKKDEPPAEVEPVNEPDVAPAPQAVDSQDLPLTEAMAVLPDAEAADPDSAPEADPSSSDGRTTEDLSTGSTPHEPARETVATAPALGALVSDEGARTPLDRAYVFGREPQYDDAVSRGAASPILVKDPDNLISRVQAYVWIDENGVSVQDAKSANGTFVAAPGASDWVRLGDGPAALPAGWSLRMGRRVFTHLAGS